MALGNNLKRIKKDTLIPVKKESATKSNPKKTVKSKTPVKAKDKPSIKASINPKPAVKPVSKPQTKAATKKEVTKKTKVKLPEVVTKPIETTNLNERVVLGGKEDSPITAKLIPSRRKTVRKTKLIFEGSLSLLEAGAIKDCLITTFAEYDFIDIQLINITHLDIIPVQLFKLFINFYTEKKVKIDSDVPFDIKIILERAGFGSFMFKDEAA